MAYNPLSSDHIRSGVYIQFVNDKVGKVVKVHRYDKDEVLVSILFGEFKIRCYLGYTRYSMEYGPHYLLLVDFAFYNQNIFPFLSCKDVHKWIKELISYEIYE